MNSVYCALHICSDLANLSNELSYLKSLDLSRGYSLFIFDKALKKFCYPKHFICHSKYSSMNSVFLFFYSSSLLKFLKFFQVLVLKSLSKASIKLIFLYLNILFLLSNSVLVILFFALPVILIKLAKPGDGLHTG